MKNFKIVVSKGITRNTLIKKAESENILKKELHSEGYSILTIEEVGEIEIKGNKFYFEILKDGEIKKGTIGSNDSFKAYLKLKDELGYDVKYIYSDSINTLEEKKNLIHELEEQYKIFKDIHKNEIKKKSDNLISKTQIKKEESVDSFVMKKELEKNLIIIDKVLKKIDQFLKKEGNDYLNIQKKEQLKQVYNELIKLKSSTNIKKLKEVSELGLIKVGEIELKILESNKDDDSRKILKETNKLLKDVGSKQSFIEKDRDINYIIKSYVEFTINFIFNKKEELKSKKQKLNIDTKSRDYLKTKSLYNKYLNKNNELNKEMINNFFIFIIPTSKNIKKAEHLKIKKIVLSQNLRLLKVKLTGNTFSYVKVVKGYQYIIGKLLNFLNFFKKPILIITFIYSSVFLTFNLLSYFGFINYELNFLGLFYFIFINLAFLMLNYTKGLISLSFNVVFLSFIYIFGLINF